jgi:hypothetical protein
MLVAIGYQESKFTARVQIGGPARGFWQFEMGGINAVMKPDANKVLIAAVGKTLAYPFGQLTPYGCQTAITHNDVMAAVFARLLLWNVTAPLPKRDQPDEGLRQYLQAWRPGKPKQDTWPDAWALAWT